VDVLRSGEQPKPIHVQVVISDRCNHSCHFCAYRSAGYTSNQLFGVIDPETGTVDNNPNRMIPFEKVVEILDDCKAMGVGAVQFTGGGEPTVHPKHPAIFQHALDLGLDVALVTNGVGLVEKHDDLILKMSWVRVSLDAATADTYTAIRRVHPSHFHRVTENVARLAATKKRTGSRTTIGVGFVVTPDNFSEVYDAVRLAHDLGVDNIRISAEFSIGGRGRHLTYYDEVRGAIVKAIRDFDDPEFKVFDLFEDRMGDLSEGRPQYERCGYMHFTTYIGGDQNVYTCCVNSYNERGLVGSLDGISFKDLWRSPHKEEMYRNFRASDCERCQFNAKNRFIAELIEEPTHVNFV